VIGVAGAAEVSSAPGRQPGSSTVSAEWSGDAVADCRRSKTVGPVADAGLTLTDRDVVQYEVGHNVHSKAAVSAEGVGGSVWARKDFELDSAWARSAELCVFTNGRVLVSFNGKNLPAYERVHIRARPYSGVYPADKFPKGHKMHALNGKPYREYWQGGWQRVPVDPKLLRKGLNTVIMRAKPGETLRFLIEPSLYPNRSAVSRDGGATWDYDRLSRAGNINGEYIVRLFLQRHPATGWIESEAVDLWPREGNTPVAVPSRLAVVKIRPQADKPFGTRLALKARLGATPAYSPDTWTPWTDAAELARGRVRGKSLAEGNYRFFQWRAELAASGNRAKAPRLNGVEVSAETVPLPPTSPPTPGSWRVEQPRIVRSSHVFAHARSTERLKLLRAHAELDEVVKGKARGVPQLLALARFTKDQFGNNKPGALKTNSSWDGLMLWHHGKGDDRQTSSMCTHRGAFFVQAVTALGYPARPCIWSHAVAEVWVDEFGKWVAFDPSGRFYFEVDGKPASMLEVSSTWDGRAGGDPERKVCTVKGPESRSKPRSNRQVAWFTRFWIPLRSNYLESPEPYEPGQGTTGFKCDSYLRWRHPHKEPLPWFSFYTRRRGDVEFTCNTVNLHLARTSKSGVLQVLVETDEPAPQRLEARFGGGDWAEVKPGFEWKLEPAGSTLEVRSVNDFGVPGRPARVTVKAAN
jgi:hypothetical protein